ncbi:enamine deaminase RidA [Sphaerisporangium krabiense]|uniref:Enamine deaminase RidA (YjgF/YER057c/UK114 family) n=1 Tax=Sphaerisporangium krabiense TaxID=763782 RepID=A0A7W8ZBZ3_9ACTN|nr:RidA family protein [Sphaerisporangium krabiense]MBB5631231.1 enamine deaminase RidA (YjgF/YER057c/UK114 family) [Sphaerisporangium krabiense]GII61156.1 enamine deaminase RidA [Sphaerisporangium krabiense]
MATYTTVPELLPPPGYAHAAVVEAGERLAFMAGAVPLDAEGGLVGEGDPAAQARQVLANLETALLAVGSGLRHVVASTVYVATTRQEDLSAVWEVVRASELSAGPHTSTLLGVSLLGYPGQIVEVTATAVVP